MENRSTFAEVTIKNQYTTFRDRGAEASQVTFTYLYS